MGGRAAPFGGRGLEGDLDGAGEGLGHLLLAAKAGELDGGEPGGTGDCGEAGGDFDWEHHVATMPHDGGGYRVMSVPAQSLSGTGERG